MQRLFSDLGKYFGAPGIYQGKEKKHKKNKSHHLTGEKPIAMSNSVFPAIGLSLWTLFEYLYSFCVILYLSYTRFSNFALRFFFFFPFLLFLFRFVC